MASNAIKIENLDPEKFVRLIGDILSTQGHTSIRVTDGPGDGGRDIHSLTSAGNKHLTQCKYHNSSNFTCTSRDISELPMAMIKLGYKEGLFATNARISPQGKREFLDNYEHLSLDFFDGKIILKAIAASGILKTLWTNGDSLKSMKTSWIFPFIIREHVNDMPIVIDQMDETGLPDIGLINEIIKKKYPNALIGIARATSSAEPFDPYRPPEPYTQEEGMFPFIFLNEIVVTGETLPRMSDFSEDLAKGIIFWLGDKVGNFSVRIGEPHIVPLEGVSTGGKMKTDIKPLTYLKSETSCGKEIDWFSAIDEHWITESDARMSEAEAIRLYNSECDVCLRYEINCRPSLKSQSMQMALRENRLLAWEKSKFAFVPEFESWTHSQVIKPDEVIKWPWNKKILCAWLHADLLGGLVSLRSMKEFISRNETAESVRLQEIENLIKQEEVFELILPEKARHMVGAVGVDPLQEIDQLRFITGEVVHYPENLPSPINPNSRFFLIEFVLLISESFDEIFELWISEFKEIDEEQSSLEREGPYAIFHLAAKNLPLLNSATTELLQKLHYLTKEIFKELESIVGTIQIHKCTKDYWKEHYGITFGLSWKNSKLTVQWKDGKPVPNSQLADEMGL